MGDRGDLPVDLRVSLEELPVCRSELRPVAAQTFEDPQPNYHGDRLTPAGKLDLDAGFGVVDDGREVTTSLGNGIAIRHF